MFNTLKYYLSLFKSTLLKTVRATTLSVSQIWEISAPPTPGGKPSLGDTLLGLLRMPLLTGTHYEHLCNLLLLLNNSVLGSRPIGTYIHLCTTPWSGFNNSPLRGIYYLWFPKLKCFSAPIRIVQISRSGISLGQR